jgi:predicted acetyltransferase
VTTTSAGLADPYPIRPITDGEFEEFEVVTDLAFVLPPPSDVYLSHERARLELDRCIAAFDGATMVGTATVFSFRMTVPGGLVPTAGVSWVSVLPPYRRRGIMDSLMRRQLSDIRERGEPVAALLPTESPLYGRYGYGMAIQQAAFTLRRQEGTFARDAPHDPAIRLRIATPADARPAMVRVYDSVLRSRPGFLGRTDVWWDRVTRVAGGKRSSLSCLLAEDETGPRGYALYAGNNRWEDEDSLSDCTLTISELVAADPAAGAALWRDLLSRDLVTEVRARHRPADDPLQFQLADPRRVRTRLSDGLWVRLIDVPEALAARRYSCPVDAVIEVRDDLLPDNAGRWHLQAGDAGTASCGRTSAAADVSLGVRELGAAYLGGTRLGSLAAAGLVNEHRPGTLAPLSAALSWDPSPWSPGTF